MRYILQTVTQATVHITGQASRSIWPGLLIYVGISKSIGDQYHDQVDKFVEKIDRLQLFADRSGKINKSLQDVEGELLIISNFTLHGRNKKGSQIDFSKAASYEHATEIYSYLVKQLDKKWIPYKAGEFGAKMQVESIVDGPVNIIF